MVPTPTEFEKILLHMQGISEEEKEGFLYPEYALGDVFLFKDMQKAVECIHTAIESGEQIGVYADYDCDGIPGAVILVDFFKKLGVLDRVHIYIPDRHDEGYGLSTLGIDALREKGVTLIITVDLGITAVSEVSYAKDFGIDVIITDHHGVLVSGYPDAYAVIHPHNSTYPNQGPCGAAVAFYLAYAYSLTYPEKFTEGWEKWLLDMVGFATLSDMMELRGENRMFVYYGIKVLARNKRLGLQTLFLKNNISPERLTEQDLTFTVAPRLNAASRMESPMLAFELLATSDSARATALAEKLEQINKERKVLVATTVKKAHSTLTHRELPPIVVVGDPAWRPAILGLVATKLSEVYERSFFVWGESGDGMFKGSCRMLDEHHASLIFQSLPEGVLLHAGGHQAAGGFAVAKDKVHFLEQALNDGIAQSGFTKEEKKDTHIHPFPLGIAKEKYLQILRSFAPFGIGNPAPLFLFENVKVTSTKMFGKQKEHLECEVEDVTGRATAFMFFVDEEIISKIRTGETLSFVGSLEAGWRGGVRIRIENLQDSL
jgi:single-stranded-DNA-specific exonuclease